MKKILSILLVSLLMISPIAVASASELGLQSEKGKSYEADSKHSKEDHKDNKIKVNDRDDDEDDEDDDETDGTPAKGTIYSINASGDAATKAKGAGHGDKKDNGKGKGRDKKAAEVESAILSIMSEVEHSSEGRIKLKILSGTLKIEIRHII